MTTMLPLAAALVTGMFVGWVLTLVYANAAISRAQERMQRKVRYWQAETSCAREAADRLARQLAARDRCPVPAPRRESR
jgi:hypothetical protein